ncbi:MAG: TIGR01777 family oxidoreductase [Actinomycetota bacterium]|nr:TIGR01777 family oxidoreductase [Actinomycetota bacterium]
MRFVIAGASGFLGTALRAALAERGHEVVRLVRADSPSALDSRWDPSAGRVDRDLIGAADVVVNLAGAPLARPWTSSYRQTILQSRIATTRTLAEAVAAADKKPAFVAQSAIGFYGNERGDTVLEETTPAEGDGFLRRVVQRWEAACAPAEQAGARVCRLRTGVVLDRRGGVLQLMLPLFRLGLAGRLGSGRQYFSAVSLDDWVDATIFLAEHDSAAGPFNVVGPQPPTNAEFTKALAGAVHRPAKIAVPAVVLRTALGEASGELLGSLRVLPVALEEAGYTFRCRSIDELVRAALVR